MQLFHSVLICATFAVVHAEHENETQVNQYRNNTSYHRVVKHFVRFGVLALWSAFVLVGHSSWFGLQPDGAWKGKTTMGLQDANAAISSAGRRSKWREALQLFQDLQPALRPSAVSFGACINALGRAKQWQRSLQLLQQLLASGLAFGVIECCGALKACSGASEWQQGMKILELMGFKGISQWMSNGLHLQLTALSNQADRLQVEVVELAEAIADLLKPGQFGDWVLVDDQFTPLPPPEFLALQTILRFRGLEDGPPALPEECVRIAARALPGPPEAILERALKAFNAGWWAHISLATETELEKDPLEGCKDYQHWIILYRKSPAYNRRVTSRKCLEIALTAGEMDKSLVKFAKDGDPSLFVWTVPPEFVEDGSSGVQTYALPILARPGGVLYAIPDKILSTNLLLDAMLSEDPGMLGPSREFNAQLMVEEDVGSGAVGVIDLPNSVTFLAVDLEDVVLELMREYDPVTDSSETIRPFYAEEPNALPKLSPVLPVIFEWIDAVAHERLNFYSAREEPDVPTAPTAKRPAAAKKAGRTTLASLASQMMTLQHQLQTVMAQQDTLVKSGQTMVGTASHAQEPVFGPMVSAVPSLSANLSPGSAPKAAAKLLGPPPRTKMTSGPGATDVAPAPAPIPSSCAAGKDQMVDVLTQQSQALTQLVAHLAGGDPISDLSSASSSAGVGLSTKGVARREKMQADLASRSSTYFMQVQQQLYKRMNPARTIPKTPEELAQADVSLMSYLERYGGYKNCRETGMIMWIVAHAMDAAAQDDFFATKEYLALLTAALEQAAMDGGWGIAYLISLMEEPPQQLFAERMTNLSAAGRPFAPLVPPSWAAVALAYMKELEVLTTRKTEMKKAPPVPPPKQPSSSQESSDNPSPKRKPRSSYSGPPTPAFFPVPLIDFKQFDRMPSGLSSTKRKLIHLRRAVHAVCMALNFWFFDGRWVGDEALRRQPNAEHLALYKRVAALIRSDGLAESFPLAKSGRKHPELISKLGELSDLLTAHGGGSASYEKGFSGIHIQKGESTLPEVTPFADLNAERLKVFGTGHWDVTQLLSDDLIMAYREPRSLLADLDIGVHPLVRDSPHEVAKLAKLWDDNNLLYLHTGYRPKGSLVKIFNCYKNAEQDRQIGDRRGQNSFECRVAGPSKHLPAGPDIMDLQVDVRSQKVVLVITDRKDYYHQLWATDARPQCLRSSSLLQGLVIDDYFAASIENKETDNLDSKAAACYVASQRAYEDADLLGSPAKDVRGDNEGKLVGAYVNSGKRALSRQLCTVGAPADKRIALSFLTLVLCGLTATTDTLHLCLIGGWVSVLAFRRPLMSILCKAYHLVDQNTVDQNNPKLVPLPRSVANELVLLATLMPLALSDLGAEYMPTIFATDASNDKGAICSAAVPKSISASLWQSCRCKGSYTRIMSPAEVILKRNGLFDEEKLLQKEPIGPDRPLAYDFDFIEVFSGASLISKVLSERGFTVGPPLDIGISLEYNLGMAHVMEWLTYLISSKKLLAFFVSPPCTTFSIMRRDCEALRAHLDLILMTLKLRSGTFSVKEELS
eukprot:s754_g17.t1